MTRTLLLLGLCLAGCRAAGPEVVTRREARVDPKVLRDAATFIDIADGPERSRALFMEASKVLLHARCVNCHPPDNSPRQGDAHEFHDPPITRGPDNTGVVGANCTSCHQDRNLELARVPGAPDWHLAPLEMAWLGRSPRQLCEQLKDPKRNGGKTLAEIVEHTAHDKLVAWGWNPGHGREPAPGTQAQFGKLMAAWAELGAQCPTGDAP